MFDYHIHSKLCRHAEGELEDYVLSAIDKKFSEIGFSEHTPYQFLSKNLPIKEYGMSLTELEEKYFSEIDRLREKYNGQIIIKTGLELDYLGWKHNEIEDLIKKYNEKLDYIIGSIHILDIPDIGIWGIDDMRFIDNYNKAGVNKIHDHYFDEMEDLIKSRTFDIIGHYDLLKKFGFRPSNKNKYYQRMEQILDLMKKEKMCLEVNTAGLRKKVKEIYPEEKIIKMAIERDISIIISSDSHKPEEIGYKFEECKNNLKKLGLQKLCKFNKRKKEFIPLY